MQITATGPSGAVVSGYILTSGTIEMADSRGQYSYAGAMTGAYAGSVQVCHPLVGEIAQIGLVGCTQ